LCLPDQEDGSRLEELTSYIAGALDTDACHPKGCSFERLIGFNAYPEEFALWWYGFTCELGCSGPCGVAMDTVTDRLVAGGAFEVA
jgi:hypothetical protein